jgi:hypothetical protein
MRILPPMNERHSKSEAMPGRVTEGISSAHFARYSGERPVDSLPPLESNRLSR